MKEQLETNQFDINSCVDEYENNANLVLHTTQSLHNALYVFSSIIISSTQISKTQTLLKLRYGSYLIEKEGM